MVAIVSLPMANGLYLMSAMVESGQSISRSAVAGAREGAPSSDGVALGVDFGAVLEAGVPIQLSLVVPPQLSAVKLAFGVVELVEVGLAVGAPHALAADVAPRYRCR